MALYPQWKLRIEKTSWTHFHLSCVSRWTPCLWHRFSTIFLFLHWPQLISKTYVKLVVYIVCMCVCVGVELSLFISGFLSACFVLHICTAIWYSVHFPRPYDDSTKIMLLSTMQNLYSIIKITSGRYFLLANSWVSAICSVIYRIADCYLN